MMNAVPAHLLAALGLGLMGAGHCLSMCGGIMGALALRLEVSPRQRASLILGYNLGRVASYCLMGLLVAMVVQSLPNSSLPVARTLAGLLLIAMGLYLAQWWRGLVKLEKLGYLLWKRIKPLGDRLLPVVSLPRAVGFGMVWGWLPCGLVYSALAYAAVQPSPWAGAAVMAAFGVGTLPAVVAGGLAAGLLRKFLAHPRLKKLFALAYMVFGVWTIAAAWQHVGHGPDDNRPAVEHHHHH